MLKRIVTYSLAGVLAVAVVLTVAGSVVKKRYVGRIAPGVTVCGRDVSGMTLAEAEAVVKGLVPECVTELRCRFLPEMREEVGGRVTEANETVKRNNNLTEGSTGEDIMGEEEEEISLVIVGREVIFAINQPMFSIDVENTLHAVTERSSEAKVWEWLYEEVTGRPARTRNVDAVFTWEEDCLADGIAMLRKVTERDRKDATVSFENGQVKVTESMRGYRLETECFWADTEEVARSAAERLKAGQVDGLVFRFYVTGTALMPNLSTAQAEKCNTVLGAFSTAYTDAGNGRAQNIEVGAKKLHGRVVLPGEELSVATALMPFTEKNGYASGGTYIDGQLSESIGGGVCQLSTTLYNALMQTKLEITERHPHSMPVGYVPLGRDAAIAGDYKDLKFKNTTNVPVLLLCEATGEEVKVMVYGGAEAKRGNVSFESVITEENEEKVTVELYRIEKGENGKEKREKVSGDIYQVKESLSQ